MRISYIPYIEGRNDYDDRDDTKYAIAIHSTENDASAEGEASYAQRRTDGTGAHFYADQDSVVQSMDTRYDRAGHAGSYEGNEHAVAVEICGFSRWSREQWLRSVHWDLLGRVLADVCREYGIPIVRPAVSAMRSNPKVKGFYGHNDMRLAWGETTHTDPGPNFPWDKLFQSVAKYLLKNEVIEVACNLNAFQGAAIQYTDGRVHAMATGSDTVREDLKGGGSPVWLVQEIKRISARLDSIEKKIDALGTAQ